MENREFIAANNLPEIEAETVDVLCVDPETGEMGKKSGATLGGGSAVDAIVTGSAHPDYLSEDTVALEQFDFATIKEKMLAGKEVVAMMHILFNYGDNYEMWAKSTAIAYNSTKDTLTIVWNVPTAYASSNLGARRINVSVDASGTVVEVLRNS